MVDIKWNGKNGKARTYTCTWDPTFFGDVHVITWTSPKKVGSQVHVYVRALPFLPFHLMSTINNSTHINLT